MLIGEYQHNIDLKGRVAVPAKFRDDLGALFYITKGLDNCLFVLPQDEWNRLVDKIKTLPISKARGLQRFFFSCLDKFFKAILRFSSIVMLGNNA